MDASVRTNIRPSFAWRWKICDRCHYSSFWKRARFCGTCGSELRVSEVPLERSHWINSWLNLALFLWVLQFVLLGSGAETEQGGFRLVTIVAVAALLMAGFAVFLIWRLTPPDQLPPKT